MVVYCFGDSNTFGYDPRSYLGGRYPAESRWVDLLAARTGWEIHNNGMNGREIPLREIVLPKTIDLLIVMLGTNDLLQGRDSSVTADRMERFLKKLPHTNQQILLIAPPPMKYGEWVSEDRLLTESKTLSIHYRNLAHRLGIRFADAGAWNVSLTYDGVHFTEAGHIAFADGLMDYLLKTGERDNHES